MQFDTTSKYASGGIDDLIFFQDANIGNHEEVQAYEDLLSAQRYSDAQSYLSSSTLHPYDVTLLNMIEKRLRGVEEHINEYVEEKPDITFYQLKEPKHEIGPEHNSWVGPNSVGSGEDMHGSTYNDLSYFTHDALRKYKHGDFT